MTIGPIYDISQIVEDPHIVERELIADYPDARHGRVSDASRRAAALGHAGLDPHAGAAARRAQPALLLAEVGIDATAYASLVEKGIACEGAVLATDEEQ